MNPLKRQPGEVPQPCGRGSACGTSLRRTPSGEAVFRALRSTEFRESPKP